MADNSVEKKFLYLLLFSALLHGALVALFLSLPESSRPAPAEPIIVELQDLPPVTTPPAPAPPVSRKADVFQRAQRETAPKGDFLRESLSRPAEIRELPAITAAPPGSVQGAPGRTPARDVPTEGRSARDELFRTKPTAPAADQLNLYPSAAKMARLEETYRKKYGPEVAEGDTRFLNTDDILFGSFLRRFETAVYGVWRYPAEAANLGIEGITPVKITFNRRGEIIGRELLQSSGSKILDNEVLRALAQIGPVGSFPRNYDKDTFNLIAFFHYGITRGAVRSLR